jgi:hypothetical protein
LGEGAIFAGNTLAQQRVTFGLASSIVCGRAMALAGAVTLIGNTVSNDCNAYLPSLAGEEFESRALVPIIYGRALRLPSSIVLFALITGGTLLALPVAATLLMLADELKLELPGETAQPDDETVQRNDNIGGAEYLRRADGITAEASAGVALEISGERKVKEDQAATQGARANLHAD